MPTKLYPMKENVYTLAHDGIRILYQPTLTGRARATIELARKLLTKK